MSIGGRFSGTDCMAVTGKDGKTVWIFELKDLKEVVPDDVWECIDAFVRDYEIDLENVGMELNAYENMDNKYIEILKEAKSEIEGLRELIDKKRCTKEMIKLELRKIGEMINTIL